MTKTGNINKSNVVGVNFDKPINDAIRNTVGILMKSLLKLDNLSNVIEDFGQLVIAQLASPLFFGIEFHMDREAKESLQSNLQSHLELVKDKYLKNREEDKRLQKALRPIKENLEKIIDVVLGNISEEVNRGAIIEGQVVNADCKNERHNKMELQYPKVGCRVAVPTRGIFISTNCVQTIKDLICDEINKEKIKK